MKSVKSKILIGMVATIVLGMVVLGVISVLMNLRGSQKLTETAIEGALSVATERVEQELTGKLTIDNRHYMHKSLFIVLICKHKLCHVVNKFPVV